MYRQIRIAVGSMLLILAGGAVLYAAFTIWRHHGLSPVERGRRVAVRMGCFACHGPGGLQGIANPGSHEDGKVPSWTAGELAEHAKNDQDIREWILDGIPQRLLGQAAHGDRRERALLSMPAYRRLIGEKDLSYLMAYIKAVGWMDPIADEAARKGREEAQEHGCFGCHGPEGRGSQSNPRSLKGYIPGWTGKDFKELAKNDGEIEEWIMNGTTHRMKRHPLASWIMAGQTISMPSYRDILDKDDLRNIIAYIHWLRR